MPLEANSSNVNSSSPVKRTFSDKLIENDKKITVALNTILLVGAFLSLFLGPVGLMLTAAVYGGLTFATNGSLQLTLGNMRNSKTEMSLAWQTYNFVYNEDSSFKGFTTWLNSQEDKEGTVRGLMVHFWTLDEATQQKMQHSADVSESHYKAYVNSSDAKADQETAALLQFDDGRADGIFSQRAKLEDERERKEEAQNTAKMMIAWQLWLQDPAWSQSRSDSFESFESWLNRFDPTAKQARFDRFIKDFKLKSLEEQQKIAKAAGVKLEDR